MANSKKSKRYPKNPTMCSYYLQAIEPKCDAINAAFPDYHPMWVIQSQSKTVSAENFKHMRNYMLSITVEQCAAYLRVHRTTINRWEDSKSAIPFMAFELLRLVYESANFRLSHKDWHGWFIDNEGRLVSAETKNISFNPDELMYARQVHQQKSFYEAEYKRLQNEIKPLHTEIAQLKTTADNNGVLDELKVIEARLADLASRLSESKVVRISSKSNTSLLEVKVA